MEDVTGVGPQPMTVWFSEHVWRAPDNALSRWRLIVEAVDGNLSWAYTYNPSLAKLGTQVVEFYRDTSMRLCIRKPKHKGE